jgi:biopolymer transport protein ExbD
MNNALLINRKTKPIGLTALIDVVFILLLFFMLTSNFNQWKAVDLQVPSAVKKSSEQQPTQVVLSANAFVRLKKESWSLEQLSRLSEQQLLNYDRQTPLIVFPEASTSVQTIVSTLEAFKNLGWQQVTLGSSLADKDSLKN